MQFDMNNSLGFILNKTALLSKAHFNLCIKEYGISPEQWSLVFRVVERSGLTQKELSELVRRLPDRACQRASGRGNLLALPRCGGAKRAGAVVFSDHQLR